MQLINVYKYVISSPSQITCNEGTELTRIVKYFNKVVI